MSVIACKGGATETPTKPVSERSDAAAATAPAPLPPQTFDLDALRVEVQFPGLRMLPEQSDSASGLVAFGAEKPRRDRTISVFLDGSRNVTLPTSAAEALASVMADDACRPGPCRELGRGALPNAGLLISVLKPRAVYTETWRRNAQQRVVRCGCEQSEIGASATHGERWLDSAEKRSAAQRECETLCRAAVPLD